MTDRELLELAAKACRYEFNGTWFSAITGLLVWEPPTSYDSRDWNPLTDDGDALRLAVTLQLRIMPQEKCVYVESNPDTLLGFAGVSVLEMYGTAPCVATLRAITRTAAEIGKQMKEQTP